MDRTDRRGRRPGPVQGGADGRGTARTIGGEHRDVRRCGRRGPLYAGRWHKDARSFVRRHRHALAERPLWFFSSGPLDASASERDIPPGPGVRRAMDRLDAREHVTFGGCLLEGAKGRVAQMILGNDKGGDFRDFPAVEAWAARIARYSSRRS